MSNFATIVSELTGKSGVLTWCRDEGQATKQGEKQMTKKAEEMERGAGMFLAFITALVSAVKEIGGSIADIHRLTTPDGVATLKKVAECIVGAAQTTQNILLTLIGTINVPAITGKFTARNKFVRDTSGSAPAKISGLGSNFCEWFLGKVEEPQGEVVLRYHRLKKDSLDRPIIEELGGEAIAETTLAVIYALMKNQRNGEDGPLLTNGYASIFYVRTITGALTAVSVYWYGDGWYVYAFSVVYPCVWDVGDRVFSRNSLES